MINVTKTYLPSKKRYLAYVDKIYDSGWVTNDGSLVRELTDRLSEYLNVNNLILVSSGTSALEVAYRTLGLKGHVMTTPFSFVATTSSLVSNGMVPSYSDIDPRSFNLSPPNLTLNLAGYESGIVATHVFGNACDIDELEKIAKFNRSKLVFDAAHCFGVRYKNKSILNYGDISCISFHATKLFHTVEGGALCVNDDNLFEEAKLRINFGIDGVDSVRSLGTNAKMNEFEAAMGLCVLDDIAQIMEQREECYKYYQDKLGGYVRFQERNCDATNNYAYFPVVFESTSVREGVVAALNHIDVFPRRYFSPSLDTLPYISKHSPMRCSQELSSKVLVLPLYPGLTGEEQDSIINVLRGCIDA